MKVSESVPEMSESWPVEPSKVTESVPRKAESVAAASGNEVATPRTPREWRNGGGMSAAASTGMAAGKGNPAAATAGTASTARPLRRTRI